MLSSEKKIPIPFIVGVPRSGTTLLRLMVDAHPEIAIPGETHFIPELIEFFRGQNLNPMSFYNCITNFRTWSDFHIPKIFFYNELMKITEFNFSKGLRCFYQLYAERHDKKKWGDKTPLYGQHLLEIQDILPEAHFIHIIRDGRDVSLSLRNVWFCPSHNADDLATYWVRLISETRRQAAQCRCYIEVLYEDLIFNPEDTLKKICSFIELDYSPLMKNYRFFSEKRLREFSGRSAQNGVMDICVDDFLEMFKRTTYEPDGSRVGVWRKEMSIEDQIVFRRTAGHLLSELGYTFEV